MFQITRQESSSSKLDHALKVCTYLSLQMLGLNCVQLDLYRGGSAQLYMLYVLCLVHCTQYKHRKYNTATFDNSTKKIDYKLHKFKNLVAKSNR